MRDRGGCHRRGDSRPFAYGTTKMANEISFTVSLTANKPSIMSAPIGRSVSGLVLSMAGTQFIGPTSMLVTTSAIAIPLGQVTTPHWAWFYNLDPTNYVQFQNGSGGAVFLRLNPGEGTWVPLDPGITPYAKANTASVQIEYLILDA